MLRCDVSRLDAWTGKRTRREEREKRAKGEPKGRGGTRSWGRKKRGRRSCVDIA